jgi:hypothetical protein
MRLQTFRASYKQTAQPIDLPPDFWEWSLTEREAWIDNLPPAYTEVKKSNHYSFIPISRI